MAYTRYAKRPTRSTAAPTRTNSAAVPTQLLIGPPTWIDHASAQQRAIWDAIESTERHVMVRALAGTGKTSTMLEAIRRMAARNPYRRIGFVAFNKNIATELQRSVPAGVVASTLHSLGLSLIRRVYPRTRVNKDKVFYSLDRNIPTGNRNVIVKIVDLCRANLIDGTDRDELLELCADYGIEFKDDAADEILNAVPETIRACLYNTAEVDFMDMIWLPSQDAAIRAEVARNRFDDLIVDEAQDMNPAQQALVQIAGDRLMFVGDSNQAIYGFMGADTESLDNLSAILESTNRELATLPLTITRRCPQIVVALAREDVPDFEAAPEAPVGTLCFGHSLAVLDSEQPTGYRLEPKPDDAPAEPIAEIGDMVVCRTNAPLICRAYALIKAKPPVPVRIKGRNFGQGLVAFIDNLKSDGTATDLLGKLTEYVAIESANISAKSRGLAAESKLQALQDKADCIEALSDGMTTVAEIIAHVETLFSDDTDHPEQHVTLSTIHKAKGLEARVIRIIEPQLLPHPMAKTPQQAEAEKHLRYVARTRSMDTLHIH